MLPDSTSYKLINHNQCFPIHSKTELEKFIKKQDEVIYLNDSTFNDTSIIIQDKIKCTENYIKSFLSINNAPQKDVNIQSLNLYNTDWLTWFLLLCFVIFAFLQKNFCRKQKNIISSFFNYRYNSQLIREGNIYNETGFYFLLFLSLISFCLLLLNWFVFYFLDSFLFVNSLILFLKILSAFLFFYFGKIMFIRIISFTFKLNKLYSDFVLTQHVFLITLGVISLFLSMILVYLTNYILIITSVLVTIGLYVNFIFRLYILNLASGIFTLFYFILYICSIEILPVLIVYKLIIK